MEYLTAPLVALAVVAVLVLMLRWTCSTGHSLVARTPRSGDPADYGLLVPVAEPDDAAAGRAWCALLARHGVRASLAHTRAGLRILVWPQQADTARDVILRSG